MQRALGLNASAVINHGPVAHVFDIAQEVAGEDDRLASTGQCQDEVFDFATPQRIQARGGFVEDDQIRVVDQRLSDADAALHALGEFADGARAGLVQAHHLDELLGAAAAFGRVDLEEAAEEVERLARVQEAVEVAFFGQVADAGLGGDIAG